VYLLVDPGFYPPPLNFYEAIGWTPVTDIRTRTERIEQTNGRTDGQMKRRVSLSVRLLDGVRHYESTNLRKVAVYTLLPCHRQYSSNTFYPAPTTSLAKGGPNL